MWLSRPVFGPPLGHSYVVHRWLSPTNNIYKSDFPAFSLLGHMLCRLRLEAEHGRKLIDRYGLDESGNESSAGRMPDALFPLLLGCCFFCPTPSVSVSILGISNISGQEQSMYSYSTLIGNTLGFPINSHGSIHVYVCMSENLPCPIQTHIHTLTHTMWSR